MPSDFLSPFLELEEEFLKSFRGLEAMDASPPAPPRGFQRRHSLCPVTLPNSKFNGGGGGEAGGASGWGPARWTRELPRSSLSHIPFRVDRSVSMIEGGAGRLEGAPLDYPPPGLSKPATPPPPPHVSTRYKTELCRTYEESGACKYGAKCQFAHGVDELRGISRHPKYKTELCRTFHTVGFCPYGARCHFVHNADEASPAGPAPSPRPPLLRHSLSFAGFSSSFQPSAAAAAAAPALLLARASSVSPPPPSTGSPELLSPLLPEPGPLKHCPFPFSGVPDLPGEDLALQFYAVPDAASPCYRRPPQRPVHAPPGLRRCSSADSLSEEGYASSCSLSSSSSGRESPASEGRRLPIFSRLSVTDE